MGSVDRNIAVIILAAGKGTRIKSRTPNARHIPRRLQGRTGSHPSLLPGIPT